MAKSKGKLKKGYSAKGGGVFIRASDGKRVPKSEALVGGGTSKSKSGRTVRTYRRVRMVDGKIKIPKTWKGVPIKGRRRSSYAVKQDLARKSKRGRRQGQNLKSIDLRKGDYLKVYDGKKLVGYL